MIQSWPQHTWNAFTLKVSRRWKVSMVVSRLLAEMICPNTLFFAWTSTKRRISSNRLTTNYLSTQFVCEHSKLSTYVSRLCSAALVSLSMSFPCLYCSFTVFINWASPSVRASICALRTSTRFKVFIVDASVPNAKRRPRKGCQFNTPALSRSSGFPPEAESAAGIFAPL